MTVLMSSAKPNKRTRAIRHALLGGILFLLAGSLGYLVYQRAQRWETTDNAQVKGNTVTIAAEVPGKAIHVFVTSTQHVQPDTLLAQLDDQELKQNLDAAKAAFELQVRQTQQLILQLQQLRETVALKAYELALAKKDWIRREQLRKTRSISEEELQHARLAMKSARSSLIIAQTELKATEALLRPGPVAVQPAVKQTAAQLKSAWIQWARTQIKAPVEGEITQRRIHPGSSVFQGSSCFTIVPSYRWVEANFKETQIAGLKPGMQAYLTSDLYGTSQVFTGVVEGIEPGTGATFSLIPAQNATGNWIKVVQRVAVRIALDPEPLTTHPLPLGASMQVKIKRDETTKPSRRLPDEGVKPLLTVESYAIQAAETWMTEQLAQLTGQTHLYST